MDILWYVQKAVCTVTLQNTLRKNDIDSPTTCGPVHSHTTDVNLGSIVKPNMYRKKDDWVSRLLLLIRKIPAQRQVMLSDKVTIIKIILPATDNMHLTKVPNGEKA